MLIVSKKSDLIHLIRQYKEQNLYSVGFVPTMGFLHTGHGSLIESSLIDNGLTVCDIFVNPLQFNEKSDYDNYPVNIDKDIRFLENIGCDVLYLPDYNDIYPEGHIPLQYHFGHLETVMEGKFRQGHFQGVAEVVRILFEIVKPDKAYFGEKDFQQLKIIESLVNQFGFQIDIVPCPIVREHDGLAMSSRNSRLSQKEREAAPFIYNQLLFCKTHYTGFSPEELKVTIEDNFSNHSLLNLEYIDFADRNSLLPFSEWNDVQSAGVFIAARLGNVRLIDNMLLF